MVPPRGAGAPPCWHQSFPSFVSAVPRRRITECCVKSWSGRQGQSRCSFRVKPSSQESRQPARSSAPHLRPPRCAPQAHQLRSKQERASGELFGEFGVDGLACAAGRPQPQDRILRRPTTPNLDPAPTSAALVVTAFVPKSFVKGRLKLVNAAAAIESFPHPVQADVSDVASAEVPMRPAGAQAA